MNETELEKPVDNLSLIRWMLEKHEHLRTNDLSRSYTLVTAAAVLLAAYSLVIGRVAANLLRGDWFVSLGFVVDLATGAGVVLCVWALISALNAAVHLGARSRDSLGPDAPARLFSHSGETVRAFRTYTEFERAFLAAGPRKLEEYLLADLYSIHQQHSAAYEQARRSGRLLVAAAALFAFQLMSAALFSAMIWFYR